MSNLFRICREDEKKLFSSDNPYLNCGLIPMAESEKILFETREAPTLETEKLNLYFVEETVRRSLEK